VFGRHQPERVTSVVGETPIERCQAQPDCSGAQLQSGHCLEHLTAEELDIVVARLRAGEPLDARHTTVSTGRLRGLLDGLRQDEGPVLPVVDFGGATFSGDAAFDGVTFIGDAGFDEATFIGDADFGAATFIGDANFSRATFSSGAGFLEGTFSGYAGFYGATFSGYVGFGGATFSGYADFGGATVSDFANFGGATFRNARFDGVTFNGWVRFDEVTFSGNAGFYGGTFSGDTDFDAVTFSGNAGFSAVTFGGDVGFDGATFDRDAGFGAATFGGDAGFDAAIFSGAAIFDEATFSQGASFTGACVRGDARFAKATFSSDAGFAGATFTGYSRFAGAVFGGDAIFDQATFSAATIFVRASFSGSALFAGATFGSGARFLEATFSSVANFDGATFGGVVGFASVSCADDVTFAQTLFERARELGPFVVGSQLVLDDCVFLERVRLEVAARAVSARATTFAAGAQLRVRWAEVALDDADFARPSTLSGAITWRRENDLASVCLLDDRHVELEPGPRLVTLSGAQVGALSLANVDLRACQFFGAHGLESLSIEASCEWSRTPAERLRVDRETIAEEHAWRCWTDQHSRPPRWLEGRAGTDALASRQIAGLYRALRKAREEDKDEAGAGDLYYGEMEMRRHRRARGDEVASSRDRPHRGDTAILHAYWLLSGYGLRPARALGALALTLLGGAALLYWFGFHEPRSYGRSLLFAIESALSVLRPPETGLSAGGEIVQSSLRLLGPLLFGLALLAVRARIKR
jgi:hypothetical protein